jgi:hypothetical protein
VCHLLTAQNLVGDKESKKHEQIERTLPALPASGVRSIFTNNCFVRPLVRDIKLTSVNLMRRDSIIPVKTPPNTKGQAKPCIPTREKGFKMPKYRGLAVADRQNHGKRARVQNWLIQDGWQLSELQNPQASWILQATDKLGRPVVIAQPSNLNDKLDIQTVVTVDEPHRSRLETLEESERQDFLTTLRSEPMRMGVDYHEVSESPVVPQQIVMTQYIYDDGLTRDTFLQRVHQVVRALSVVQLTFARKFADTSTLQHKVGFVN